MDWKLIHVWEPAADDPQPQSLTDALLQARTSGTAGHAPYFIGVKLHDTDFTIQDDALIANNVFNSATKRVRPLRMRWTDTVGSSGERALTMVISPAIPWSAPLLSTGTDGSIHLQVQTRYGSQYTLQTSTDLINWTNGSDPNSQNVTATAASLEFIDPTPGVQKKFYKVVLTP